MPNLSNARRRLIIQSQLETLANFKANRSQTEFNSALSQLQSAAQDPQKNIYEAIVNAVVGGLTHGEVVRYVRQELGFGQPQTIL